MQQLICKLKLWFFGGLQRDPWQFDLRRLTQAFIELAPFSE
jgi:hypothetical protein